MVFYLNDTTFRYELEKLCRIYLPFEKFIFTETAVDLQDDHIFAERIKDEAENRLRVSVRLDGKHDSAKESVPVCEDEFSLCERTLALMLYNCLCKITGYRSPWGILTGVRPAKLMGKLIKSDGESNAAKYFTDTLLVEKSKVKLCLDCCKSEESIIDKSRPSSFSLYISVPFCPSRCSYCSFVSHSVEQAKKLIPEYVRLLCEEIKYTAEIANRLGLTLMTVYIGGGTPTTLSGEQLCKIMETVKTNFRLDGVPEYTVEAGRPDTVTQEKLEAIKRGGATRISINPQTLDDEVLRKIGRRHTSAQMYEAFSLARQTGFHNINTDIIAGLTGDSLQSFQHTVDALTLLSPENITVHTLSMKRASNLNQSHTVFDGRGEETAEMVGYANRTLTAAGILPYYMYRQSKTLGNLENVGFAKPGYEGLYNVYIMDETHTILACGASAVTKLRQPDGPHIERIFNYKYPYEYISRFDSVLHRKDGIAGFYRQYGAKHWD